MFKNGESINYVSLKKKSNTETWIATSYKDYSHYFISAMRLKSLSNQNFSLLLSFQCYQHHYVTLITNNKPLIRMMMHHACGILFNYNKKDLKQYHTQRLIMT